MSEKIQAGVAWTLWDAVEVRTQDCAQQSGVLDRVLCGWIKLTSFFAANVQSRVRRWPTIARAGGCSDVLHFYEEQDFGTELGSQHCRLDRLGFGMHFGRLARF